jgi:Na+-translocating ferredoxin:NAD+ oxidoreductase RnfG subunit
MNTSRKRFPAMLAGLLVAATVCAQQPKSAAPALADADVRAWFPAMAQRQPLASQPAVETIKDDKGTALGWLFCTDQIAPVVRGKRGEIGVWVALGSDGKIRGVKVGRHREDKKWFDRIREPFYKAFEGQPADGSGGKPDAVTTATVSSRAMIDDVFGACRTVMELPGVRELLAAGAAADKTAPAQN